MRLVRRPGRTTRAIVAVSRCDTCGHGLTLLDPHPAAAVEHRCPTGVVGPVWTVVEPPAGPALTAVAEATEEVA